MGHYTAVDNSYRIWFTRSLRSLVPKLSKEHTVEKCTKGQKVVKVLIFLHSKTTDSRGAPEAAIMK